MIRVVCRKIPIRADCSSFPRLINRLTETVATQPGFIRSDSFWCSNTTNGEIHSMSDWKSKAQWDNWYTSSDRHRILSDYTDTLHSEQYKVFIKKHPNFNIFLL